VGWGVPVGGGDVLDVPLALQLEDLAVDAAQVLVVGEGHEVALLPAEGVGLEVFELLVEL
jgi:hypothetical protein